MAESQMLFLAIKELFKKHKWTIEKCLYFDLQDVKKMP